MSPLTLLESADVAERRANRLRRSLGLFGLLLMAATWRLWTPQDVFPQVPLLLSVGELATGWQWVATAASALGLAGMLALPAGRAARAALVVFTAGMLLAIVFDQQRFQPWAYQILLFAVILAAAPPRSALALLKLLVIAFYFESALTKLDNTFLHTLGQQFLAALAGLVGLSIENWNPTVRLAAAAVFPLGELLVAVGLFFRMTRRPALLAAILLHVVLLVILGPWGLDHEPGVLLWNACFIVQDVILFWTPASIAPGAPQPQRAERMPWPVLALVLLVIFLPLAEPWGVWDTWPSWGLYAPSAERVTLEVHRIARQQLPPELDDYLVTPDDPSDPWLEVRLDRWALDALGAPIYPQARVQLGVALAVAEGAGLADRARIIRYDRASRWTGERDYQVLQGTSQARAVAAEYLFNARPSRPYPPRQVSQAD